MVQRYYSLIVSILVLIAFFPYALLAMLLLFTKLIVLPVFGSIVFAFLDLFPSWIGHRLLALFLRCVDSVLFWHYVAIPIFFLITVLKFKYKKYNNIKTTKKKQIINLLYSHHTPAS